jgi:hypothetical protein
MTRKAAPPRRARPTAARRASDQAGRAAIMHYGTRRRALLAGAWDLPTYAQDVIPYLSRAEAAEAGSKE